MAEWGKCIGGSCAGFKVAGVGARSDVPIESLPSLGGLQQYSGAEASDVAKSILPADHSGRSHKR